MATVTIYPDGARSCTGSGFRNVTNNLQNAMANDDTEASSASSTSSGYTYFRMFWSANKIANNLPSNAIISSVSCVVQARSSRNSHAFDSTGYRAQNLYNLDGLAGDGSEGSYPLTYINGISKSFGTSISSYTVAVPVTNLSNGLTMFYRFENDYYLSNTLYVRRIYLTVTYTIPSYTLTVSKTGNGSGTVTGGGTYTAGTSVQITATEATGSYFNGWTDGNRTTPRTVVVNGNVTYTAAFELFTYPVRVEISPSGAGSVTGTGTYYYGNTCTLTATANTGYRFLRWSDGNTSATRTFTVTTNVTLTAVFEKLAYQLTTAVSPSGAGSVTGGGTYNHGDTATLTATAATGYRFVRWSDNVTTATRYVTVTTAATYTAIFQTVITEPEIRSVTITPNPVDCSEGYIISVEVEIDE